jgi:phospholipid/cholesterol/gamma-HCH transport system substrate-binding protein
MSGRTRAERIAASPTVVGAITTLIVIVAVFLAYNASNGLPFVPVYRVSAEMPNASRLVRNNEVRIGGHRVGVVESVEATQNKQTGEAAAKLNLKLDRSIKPLPATTQIRVRYKSSFGLKYLELVRKPGPALPEGGTLPVTNAVPQTEFDAIANTFDTPTRENIRTNLANFGNAFAGRGASLNQAIANLNPLFKNLEPVAKKLVAPSTRLQRFFPELADAARIVAPVAAQQSELFTNMAITFGALSADPQALRDTITSGVPTLETGIRTLPFQRVFLANFAELSRLLRPGVHDLRFTLPTLNDALRIGTPVLKRTPANNKRLEGVFTALLQLVESPDTKISLVRLTDLFETAGPAAAFIGPYQTVCNYFNYWFTFLPEHLTQAESAAGAGTTQRIELVQVPGGTQGVGAPFNAFLPTGQSGGLGGYAGLQASAYAGIESLPDVGQFQPHDLGITHGDPYGPALDANGNPDCQSGQIGNVLGNDPIRTPSGSRAQGNDNAIVAVADLKGSRGPTSLYYHRNGQRDFNHTFPAP